MSIGPGNIANLMPPQPDDAARKLRDLQRTQREQAAAKTGQAMQIGAGGILVNGGGSITISGSGSLNVGSGALNSAGSISAGTTITAGGAITGQSLAATAGITAGTTIAATGAVTGASVTATGNVQGGGLISTGAANISGTLAVGSVVSSGQVQSNGSPFKSLPSHNYNVTSGYVATWTDGDGTIGTSPSSSLVKTSLTPMTADDARKLLNLTPYWGRYLWDDDSTPLKVFFLAEDVQAAGFGPDVAPVVVGEPMQMMIGGQPVIGSDGNPVVIPVGQAYTVNYSQMVVPLIAACRDGGAQMAAMQATITSLQSAIDAMTARLTAAGIA